MSNESHEVRMRAQALQKEQEAAGVLLGLCASSGMTKDTDSPQSVHSADVAGANLRVSSAQRGRRGRGDSNDNSDSTYVHSMMPPMYAQSMGRPWHHGGFSSFMSPNHPSHGGTGAHGFGSPAFHPPSASSSHTPGVVSTSAAMRMNMLRNGGMSSPGYASYPPPTLGMPGFAGLPTGASGHQHAATSAHSAAAQMLLTLSPQAYVKQMSLTAAAAEAGVSPADLVAAAQALRARSTAGSPAGPTPPRDTTVKVLDFDGQTAPKRKRTTPKHSDSDESDGALHSPSSSAAGGSTGGTARKPSKRRDSAPPKSANCVTQRFASNVNRRSDFRVPVEAVLRFQGSRALHNTGRGASFSATADSRVMDETVRQGLLQAKPHPLILQSAAGSGTDPSSSDSTPASRRGQEVPGSAASAASAASMHSQASADEGSVVSLRNGCMGLVERDIAHTSAAALDVDAALLVSRLLVASQLPEDVFGIERLAELRQAGVEPSTSRCQADERGMEMYALGKQLWLAWIQLHCVKPFPTPYLSALLRHITGFTRRNEVDLYRNYRRRHLGSVMEAVREAAGVAGSPPRPPSGRQGRKRGREEE